MRPAQRVPYEHTIDAGRPSWGTILDPRGLVRTLARHRDLLMQLIGRSVGGRYRGSYLGMGWAVLQPLLMLAVYTWVFGMVLRARWRPESTSQLDFAVTLFCGLIPFGIVSESATNAPGAIVGNASYVKRVVFPLEILPLVVVGTAALFAAINAGILVAATTVLQGPPPWTAALLPLAFVPCLLLAAGLAWGLAALGVFVRDTGAVVAFVMQILFFATPILYPAAAIPERFQWIVAWNPLAVLVDTWRALALGLGPVPWRAALLVTAGAAAAALVGRALFLRSQRAFADVV
jgi:lipopolysaccharide transport system permease protein